LFRRMTSKFHFFQILFVQFSQLQVYITSWHNGVKFSVVSSFHGRPCQRRASFDRVKFWRTSYKPATFVKFIAAANFIAAAIFSFVKFWKSCKFVL
jgi:hypothetical protein